LFIFAPGDHHAHVSNSAAFQVNGGFLSGKMAYHDGDVVDGDEKMSGGPFYR